MTITRPRQITAILADLDQCLYANTEMDHHVADNIRSEPNTEAHHAWQQAACWLMPAPRLPPKAGYDPDRACLVAGTLPCRLHGRGAGDPPRRGGRALR
jgi:hypothetical protein